MEKTIQELIEKLKSEVLNEVLKGMQVQQPQPKKLFYNLKELVQLTGITYLGLKGRLKRGTLKGAKDGNTWLVSAVEVERLINHLNHQKRG